MAHAVAHITHSQKELLLTRCSTLKTVRVISSSPFLLENRTGSGIAKTATKNLTMANDGSPIGAETSYRSCDTE